MALLLNNSEIEQILTPELCLGTLEQAFGDLARDQAANMLGREVILARAGDLSIPGARAGHAYHGLEVQTGTVPKMKTASLRVKSDILYWPEIHGSFRRKKYPAAADGLYCGFIVLFNTDTGEPTAIMPDGLIQRMRVGTTSALGAKYLSLGDATVACVIGAGFQAEVQVLALLKVRQLEQIRIFSPTASSRDSLAARLDSQISPEVVAVGSVEEAVKGAQIVHTATNSRSPVLSADWLDPGTHVGVIGPQEIGEDVLRSAGGIGTSRAYTPKQANTAIADGYAEDVHEDEFRHGWWHNEAHWRRMVELGDLINGRAVDRLSVNEITLFVNKGAPIQFAAVGERVANSARAAKLGREFPTDWLLQEYQP